MFRPLLDSLDTATCGDVAPTPSSTCELSAQFDAWWADWMEEFWRSRERAFLLGRQFNGLIGNSSGAGVYRKPAETFDRSDETHLEAIIERADEVIRDLIRMAERRFAPPGGSLSIERADHDALATLAGRRFKVAPRFYGREPEDNDQREQLTKNFRPGQVWDYLEKTFGGNGGREAGYRQLATRLRSLLDLDHQQPKTIGRGVLIEVRIWSEKSYRGDGTHEISYTDREKVQKICNAFVALGAWCGRSDMGGALGAMVSKFSYGRHTIEPREKFTCDDMVVTIFLKKLEVCLTTAAAADLQRFIAQYGSE